MSDDPRKEGPDTNPLPIGDQIEQLSRAFYSAFERVNERFDRLDARLDKLEERVEKGFEAVNARFDAIEHRLDAVEQRLDRLEIQFSKLGYKLDALNDSLLEMKGEFRVFEKRLYLLEERPT